MRVSVFDHKQIPPKNVTNHKKTKYFVYETF